MKSQSLSIKSRLRVFLWGLACGVASTALIIAYAPTLTGKLKQAFERDTLAVMQLRVSGVQLRGKLTGEDVAGVLVPNGEKWQYVNPVTKTKASVNDQSIQLTKTADGTVEAVIQSVEQAEPKGGKQK